METTHRTDEQRRVGLALLAIRIAAALAFLYHGGGILFGWFDGPGVGNFARFMHFPVPVAFLVGLAEFCGGLALLTGIMARLGAACLLIVMLGAIFLVHLPHGFDIQKQGMEYALTHALIALGVLIAGAGPYSLAYPLGLTRWFHGRHTVQTHPPQSPPVVQP